MNQFPTEINLRIASSSALGRKEKRMICLTSKAWLPLGRIALYEKWEVRLSPANRKSLSSTFALLLKERNVAHAVRKLLLSPGFEGLENVDIRFWSVVRTLFNISSIQFVGIRSIPEIHRREFFAHLKSLNISQLILTDSSICGFEDAFFHITALISNSKYDCESLGNSVALNKYYIYLLFYSQGTS